MAPRFLDFMAERFGPSWVLSERATERLRRDYGRIVHPREYRATQAEYVRAHGPALGLQEALREAPPGMSADEVAVLCGWRPPNLPEPS